MRVAIGLRLEANEDWEYATTYVTEAERLGVDFVWSHESWGLDAATPLAFMAARTSRIRLGSGIMQAGTRTPALLAMTALSLASMSGGRFVLGLGVSGPQVIEGWHGIRFDRPVRRLRETIEIVRRATRGEEGERGDGVVAPRLRRPHRMRAQPLGLDDVGAALLPVLRGQPQRDRDVHRTGGAAPNAAAILPS